MAFSRRAGVIGIVGVSWLVAVACNDDADRVTTRHHAGKAGEAPSGGNSSAGGSVNNGGTAGTTAGATVNGGMSGMSATSGGGAGGEAGSAGVPNSAGQAGAAMAGAGGTTEPAGGASGAGGAGGAGAGGAAAGEGGGGAAGNGGSPAALAATCSFTCSNDDACIIVINNVANTTQKCNATTHRCQDPVTACSVDLDCLPSLSFWSFSCTDDSGCFPDVEACVDANGHGFCAGLPDPTFPDSPCTFGTPRTLPRFGAAGTVEACASPDARCFAGACRPGCGDAFAAGACGQGSGDTCSAATGLCDCTQGTECTKTGICTADGHCQECETNDDCAATVAQTGLGICVGGKCGCGSPGTCVNPGYASATAVCQ